jgi:UDP-3-O-[3-hydroxymyristoyl] glucosamine N-acyltransferase
VPHLLAELAQRDGATLRGDDAVCVARRNARVGRPGAIAFPRQSQIPSAARVDARSAVIVAPEMTGDTALPALVDANPYAIFAKVGAFCIRARRRRRCASVGGRRSAREGRADAAIGATGGHRRGRVVGERASIGAGSVVGAGASSATTPCCMPT